MRRPVVFSSLLGYLLTASSSVITAGSLVQFALRKALGDAEEVFGPLSSHSSSPNANWMHEGGTGANATTASDAEVRRRIFEVKTSDLGPGAQVRGRIVLFRRFDLDKLEPHAQYEDALWELHLSLTRWPDDSPDFTVVYNDTTGVTLYGEDMADGEVRGGVDHWLVPVLKGLKGQRLGIVVLDFFEQPEGLVNLIIGRW
ncbi:hypothetical protein F5X99DRAFT_414790 [Biscogniauxia marginata]|nr:hypothetical protein F5X99DRAFT_414790 [Biscogniauxia marginata]